MNLLKRFFGSGNAAATSNADELTLRRDDLLGVIVWIQALGKVAADEHAAAMKFFEEHNPQAIAALKNVSQQIQVGVVKLDKPRDEFEKSAVEAASRQAKDLDPCVLVVQRGSLQTDDLSVDRRYALCSFFLGPKTVLVLPGPRTQIVLK